MKVLVVADIFEAYTQGAIALGENIYTTLEQQSVQGVHVHSVFDLARLEEFAQADIFGESQFTFPFVRAKIPLEQMVTLGYDILFLDSEFYTLAEVSKVKEWEAIKKVKIDSSLLSRELNVYLDTHNIEIKPAIKKQLLSISDPLYHLNTLSLFGLLSEKDFGEYLEETTKQVTPLFWLQLTENNAASQVKQWFKQIGEEEVQLGLALATNQVQKSKSNFRNLGLQALIEADRTMKSSSKIQPLTALRLALYRIQRSNKNN